MRAHILSSKMKIEKENSIRYQLLNLQLLLHSGRTKLIVERHNCDVFTAYITEGLALILNSSLDGFEHLELVG
jgi:hypothetical protein